MNPPKYRKNSINRYSIKEEQLAGNIAENVVNYDLMTAIMICLGDAGDENSTGILRLLEVLLSSERDAREKKQILQTDFDIQMTKTLEREVTSMCNLSQGVEEKGIAKGLQEGLAKGEEKNQIESIHKLMRKLGMTAEEAMDFFEIPNEQRVRLSSLL